MGYFTIDDVIEDSPNDMWKTTHEVSGITKEYFDAYFSDCDMAHAIAIGEVVKFDTPIDPYIELDNFHAPQNFMYVDDDLEKLSVCFTQKR